ncbi:MAG: ABC transporter ATP-binding protein [Pseudomonadota bacterium]
MQPIIETRQLCKRYADTLAVDHLDLSITEGQCFGLLGPNGAGKTTTIEMIEGITQPTSGDILFRGKPAGSQFRQQAGIAFQNTALQDFITVKETLNMFHALYPRGADLPTLIDDCSLGNLLERDNRHLSGGQRQRLLLAIALVNEPDIVFLDEPTTGMDPQARRNFWSLVERIKARSTSVVLTTHYMEEAHTLCDDIAIMDKGCIIAQGPPDALLDQHYANSIIELPAEALGDQTAQLDHARISERGMALIETDDVSRTLQELLNANVPLQKLRVRQRDLEDLFIDLTGRALRA